jgi:hypothetical protein
MRENVIHRTSKFIRLRPNTLELIVAERRSRSGSAGMKGEVTGRLSIVISVILPELWLHLTNHRFA